MQSAWHMDLLNFIYLDNFHAVGMAVARPYGSEIDFVKNPISEPTAWIFVILPEFNFIPLLKIKIYEKNSLPRRKLHFWRPILINEHVSN